MRDYWIYEHDPQVWKEHFSQGFWALFDQLGFLNVIDAAMGELQMATDSRSKRRRARHGGRVRFILPRTAIYTHGVNGHDIKTLLGKYGIRTRRYMFDHRNVYFTVRSSQAQWAVTVLERWKAGQLGPSWAEKAEERDRQGPGLWDRLWG